MTALPCKADAEKLLPKDNPDALRLYDAVLLPAEKAAGEATDNDATLRVMFSRIVGYLLLYPPSEQARAVLQSEVECCQGERDQNQAVYGLGEKYVMHFILPFFTITEETTPQPLRVEDHSRPSHESIRASASQGRLNSPRNLSDAKDFALVRDNFRCMVSHASDYFALQSGILHWDSQGSPWTVAHCCHIFPEALEDVRDDKNGTINIVKNHSTALWTILGRFGYERIHNELSGTKIHRLENVMTLATSIHALFRAMFLWFEKEEDGQADCYHVGVGSPLIYEEFELPVPEKVQFVANANLPLPNPTYLHIHASCCRIAHLSGARDHLDSIFLDEVRKTEDLDEEA
ncbi:hypothetical protein LXA43DRAFT_1025506 [Ganoderma leucocontextum]|nr:hypothetical protein LXA43DRAFT_1025506 [Ganoderma leucocontextum]